MKNILFIVITTLCFLSCKKNHSTKELEGLEVPDGFTIERIVTDDLIEYPMFGSFDDRGDLFVFESTGTNDMGTEKMLEEPSYQIRKLSDADGDGIFDSSIVFAEQLPFPMGGEFINGSLYVAAAPDLLKLTDTDGDGKADTREVILTGWKLHHNGAILSGPFMGKDGWLYLADARRGFDITNKEGKQMKGKGTRIWRCKPDGSELEWLSGGGFDNSIEIVFMPTGESIGTMTYFTDPRDGQRDALMHWIEGGVYPKDHPSIREDNLPRTGPLMPTMTKMARVAPSGLMRYESGVWGKEFQGNIFSAEFNTGRIMRYKVVTDSATYSTEESVFISANGNDVHPTDVMEDADGSLLVMVTGGWFIEGCPLSRVAKPEVRGGIYRIKKNDSGSSRRNKSWGNDLDIASMNPSEIFDVLSRSKFKISGRAFEELIKRGTASLTVLEKTLQDEREKNRIDAVFALYRIGGEEAIGLIRTALEDPSDAVRTAAVRCLGLQKDTTSVNLIEGCLKVNSMALMRQAATALGQIGSPGSIDILLSSLDQPIDRFTEHSIRYALYKIGEVERLKHALKENTGASGRGALLVLDQIEEYTLTSNDVLPFLKSNNPKDRNLAIWLAANHPEWENMIGRFITGLMKSGDWNDSIREHTKPLFLTFSESTLLQKLIGQMLSGTTSGDQEFALQVIYESNLNKLPKGWSDQLHLILNSQNRESRYIVLDLIESRGWGQFVDELTLIVNNEKLGNELRLKAMRARLRTDDVLSEGEGEYLIGLLDATNESVDRQEAAQLLSQSLLSRRQLIEIAENEITNADLFLLPKLIQVFKGYSDKNVGRAMVKGLGEVKDGLDNVSLHDIESVLSEYPEVVKEMAKPLMSKIRTLHAERLLRLDELDSSLKKGDVGRGRKLFYGKAICSSCHAIGGDGSDFGPDLSNIGEIRSRHDILEALVYPSASFAREYDTYEVKTSDNTYQGIIKDQTEQFLLLKIGPNSEVRIPQNEIISIETKSVSLMPPGLEKQLTIGELSDLMAFLESLPYNIDRLIELNKNNN
ncbi:PVC-type heme-binding CxxCH protein [Membranihabitans maritimus]|uniref:PVC-type heme-binding CxxCH protein n=1 Tax=Membranihabitans maritimus TaxID=2904244 RepID=UPI001F470880|nr:PVC-type heme-binding CxxCH protein [Membranihabitans maritimus]